MMYFSLYVIATLYILHLSQLARYILKNPIYTMPTLYTLHLSQSIIRPAYKTQTYSILISLLLITESLSIRACARATT